MWMHAEETIRETGHRWGRYPLAQFRLLWDSVDLMNSPMPYEPPNSPPGPPVVGEPYRGSLMKGFLLGWAVLIGGYVIVGVLFGLISNLGGSGNDLLGVFAMFASILPWGGLLALIVYFAVKNEPRSAIGVVITFGSLIGLGILLVAACFGIIAMSGSGWH